MKKNKHKKEITCSPLVLSEIEKLAKKGLLFTCDLEEEPDFYNQIVRRVGSKKPSLEDYDNRKDPRWKYQKGFWGDECY